MPVSLTVPRLEAAPVVLRAFLDEDVPLVQQVAADPLIPLITTVPTTADAAAARAYVARQGARAATGEGYSFAVVDGSTGAAVGQIGLWLRDVRHGRAEVGYWIAGAHRRRGWARRALSALSAWGLGLPDVHRLECHVEPWNVGSCRAAEGAGYQREGLLRSWQAVGDERRDMYVYSLVRDDLERGA